MTTTKPMTRRPETLDDLITAAERAGEALRAEIEKGGDNIVFRARRAVGAIEALVAETRKAHDQIARIRAVLEGSD